METMAKVQEDTYALAESKLALDNVRNKQGRSIQIISKKVQQNVDHSHIAHTGLLQVASEKARVALYQGRRRDYDELTKRYNNTPLVTGLPSAIELPSKYYYEVLQRFEEQLCDQEKLLQLLTLQLKPPGNQVLCVFARTFHATPLTSDTCMSFM
jgi:hypothetical protein